MLYAANHEHGKKKIVMHLLFKLGHNFASWQFSVTCCQDDIAEAHWIEIWDFATSAIYFWSLTHQLTFLFQAFEHIFMRENIPFQRRSRNYISCYQYFYHMGINNLVNWWQKCIDVQGSYFEWLKHCLPNPSAQAGYDTRSIFKQSLTGLNSEFSFS